MSPAQPANGTTRERISSRHVSLLKTRGTRRHPERNPAAPRAWWRVSESFQPITPGLGLATVRRFLTTPRLPKPTCAVPEPRSSPGLSISIRTASSCRRSAGPRQSTLHPFPFPDAIMKLTPELRNCRFLQGLPVRTSRHHPRLDHAAGRPVSAGVHGGPQQGHVHRTLQTARTWPPRSRSPPSGCSASMRPSCSPTCCRSSSRWASTSNTPKGEGPVIHNPLLRRIGRRPGRELEDVGELGFVFDAVKLIRRELPADIPLLGFAGAPFTLASYAIEGGGSKNYVAHANADVRRPGRRGTR